MQRRQRLMPLGIAALILASNLMMAGPASAANGSVVYTYDALGRVLTASYDTGVFIFYTYDANGNRLSQTINTNTATLSWTVTGTPPCTVNCWGGALWKAAP